MSKIVPCRSKHPEFCPYHGAQKRLEKAIKDGDFDAYGSAVKELRDALRIDEVQKFLRVPNNDMRLYDQAEDIMHADPEKWDIEPDTPVREALEEKMRMFSFEQPTEKNILQDALIVTEIGAAEAPNPDEVTLRYLHTDWLMNKNNPAPEQLPGHRSALPMHANTPATCLYCGKQARWEITDESEDAALDEPEIIDVCDAHKYTAFS